MRTDQPIGEVDQTCGVCGVQVPLTIHADQGAPDVRLMVDETEMRAHELICGGDSDGD